MLISGELDTAAEAMGEGNSGGGNGGAGASAGAPSKRSTRALIYTGDLGRYSLKTQFLRKLTCRSYGLVAELFRQLVRVC